MTREEISKEYFEWLFEMVCKNLYGEQNSYRDLLNYLHDVEFISKIPRDQDRASDGKDLRRRFALEYGFNDVPMSLRRPCSILEMMIGLAIRCEETIMDDTDLGDRTGQWFWGMIVNLDLGAMVDRCFDIDHVDYVIDRFLNREYEPDGRGGLFTVRNYDYDLRYVDIWAQMCWYLDEYYSN